MKQILITLLFGLSVVVPRTMYQQYRAASTAVEAQAATPSSPAVLGSHQEQVYFTVNVPSRFLGGITAPNVVYSVNGENGDITIDNSLVAGSGISISDRTITNTGILTLVAGNGISVDGNKITNSGITSLSAGTGISIDGNKITNTYSFTPDYTQSGWSDNGTSITLTTTTDSVTVGDLTAGAVTVDSLTTGGLSLTSDLTVSSGHSLLPSTDLGSDIGSSSFRFNNLWVANINSNSSQSFSGQTTFSYPPTDTTINQASVLINPTTAAANGQLLGLAIAGYEKAVIDEDGDIILGYNSLTSPPTTDYPLDIYGHSGTRVAYVNTLGAMLVSDGSYSSPSISFINDTDTGIYRVTGNDLILGVGGLSNGLRVTASNIQTYKAGTAAAPAIVENNDLTSGIWYPSVGSWAVSTNGTERLRINSSGNVGIGTTSPASKLHVAGDVNVRNSADTSTIFNIDSANQIVSAYGSRVQFGNLANSHTIRMDYGSTSNIYIPNWGDNLSLYTIGGSGTTNTGQLFLSQSGNVGIGTTSPGNKLVVYASDGGQSQISIKNSETGSGSQDGLVFALNTNSTHGIVYNRENAALAFGTNNIERMRIDSSGNVGIGTTSPGVMLDISGDLRTAGDITIGDRLILNTYGSALISAAAPVLYNDSSNLYIQSRTSVSTSYDINMVTGNSVDGISSKLIIKGSGNVGIGTTSPGALLHVYNNGSLATARIEGSTSYGARLSLKGLKDWVVSQEASGYSGVFRIYNNTDSVTALTILPTGQVGIGLPLGTNPTSKLHVSGAVTGKALAIFDETGNQDLLTASASGVTKFRIGNDGTVYTDSAIKRMTAGSMTFYSSTNQTFAYLAHDNANFASNAYSLSSYSGAYVFYPGTTNTYDLGKSANKWKNLYLGSNAYIDGNVGIGTTSPGYKLSINTGTADFGFTESGGVASFGTYSYTPLSIKANGNHAIYISQGANVGIGALSASEKLDVTGNIKTSSLTTGTVYSNAGVLTNTDPSDINLKTNVLSLPDGTLDKVLGLRTVSYNWKSTGDGALGFVAQEVQNIFPELVGTNKDGSLGLYTTQFIPLLTKAIQEQQLQIDEVRLSSASAQITNEEWSGVNTLLASIQAAIDEIKQKLVGMSERFRTKELCLGNDTSETCVTKEQLEELIKLIPSPTPSISPSPSPVVSSEPSPSPSIEASPTASASAEPVI